MTDDGDPGFVQISVGDQVIDGAVHSPSPRGDRSPIVRSAPCLARWMVKRMHSVAEIVAIGVDVAAVKTGQRVTPVDRLLEGPNIFLSLPAGVGRLHVSAPLSDSSHPWLGELDLLFVV